MRTGAREIISRKDKRAYEATVRVIDDTIGPLYAECGRSGDFEAYVDEVRATHKPKRNLMKLMDGLPTPDGQRCTAHSWRSGHPGVSLDLCSSRRWPPCGGLPPASFWC